MHKRTWAFQQRDDTSRSDPISAHPTKRWRFFHFPIRQSHRPKMKHRLNDWTLLWGSLRSVRRISSVLRCWCMLPKTSATARIVPISHSTFFRTSPQSPHPSMIHHSIHTYPIVPHLAARYIRLAHFTIVRSTITFLMISIGHHINITFAVSIQSNQNNQNQKQMFHSFSTVNISLKHFGHLFGKNCFRCVYPSVCYFSLCNFFFSPVVVCVVLSLFVIFVVQWAQLFCRDYQLTTFSSIRFRYYFDESLILMVTFIHRLPNWWTIFENELRRKLTKTKTKILWFHFMWDGFEDAICWHVKYQFAFGLEVSCCELCECVSVSVCVRPSTDAQLCWWKCLCKLDSGHASLHDSFAASILVHYEWSTTRFSRHNAEFTQPFHPNFTHFSVRFEWINILWINLHWFFR